MDQNSPASLSLLNKIEVAVNNNFQNDEDEDKDEEFKKDYSNHEYLLLNDEFKDIT